MVVAVSFHQQQSDNFCKIQKENTKWTWAIIYVWCFIILLSSAALCMCVYYTTLRARGVCTLQDYWCWICSPGPLLPASSSSKALDETEMLESWQLAGWRYGWGWHSWHTFRTSPNWTDIAWHSHFVTISANNQFRYFAEPQEPWHLAWSTHFTSIHTNCEMLTGKKHKLCMQHCGCKLSPSLRNETQYLEL